MSAKIEQLVAMRLTSYFKEQPKTPALTELRSELAADLNEAANDKERAGLDPEAAVAEAFSDFGDINELIRQINAENGTTTTIHGHHVVMDNDGLSVDDGQTLKINADGIYLKGGRALKADADGVSINNGAIQADTHGLKLGSWTFDEDGINLNGDAQTAKPQAAPINLAQEYSETLPLVNEQRFDAATLTRLTVAYKAAQVKIIPTQGASQEVIVREYMNHKNAAYQSQIEQAGDELKVVQGKVPFLIPLRVHVQIHVPADFTGNLTLTNRSGHLLVAGFQRLNALDLQVLSGNAVVSDLHSRALSMDVTSGDAELTNLRVINQLGLLVKSGRTRLTTVTAERFIVSVTSGTVRGTALTGGGSWTVKSGSLKLDLAAVVADVHLMAKSGTIKVTVPTDASYAYELESHSGRVVAPKNGTATHLADGYQAGRVGVTGQYLIQGQTTSGTIKLS
ncbi:hypothetical protein D1831_10495 [Lactiplantibacillus garii]|uniref:DUF4097 domain-containing protein n=1 Tax=Lactiplantibacillus garii TaxID=2306423 RepID=A0A426D588_9LACO|nr:DUF4097 family beta strand repeat-containing protein [Lactiplantibacillus garii]RRK09847.1 hypothetical protein D1831_10495 [Lactiplantibacillus garii]